MIKAKYFRLATEVDCLFGMKNYVSSMVIGYLTGFSMDITYFA